MSRQAFVLSALLLIPLYGQQTPREFDVISIKPFAVGANQGIMRFSDSLAAPHAQGNKFAERSTTLQWLVMEAWGLQDFEISGLPDWGVPHVGGTYFQVEAIAPGSESPGVADLQQMLQSLLAKRFALKTHRELKQIPVYALVPGKNGTKLRPLRDDEPLTTGRATPEDHPTINGRIAPALSLIRNYADRPVVDETGLKGNYEMANIDWSEFTQERRADPQGAWGSLIGVLKDKWGLEVKARTDAISVLVIDHELLHRTIDAETYRSTATYTISLAFHLLFA